MTATYPIAGRVDELLRLGWQTPAIRLETGATKSYVQGRRAKLRNADTTDFSADRSSPLFADHDGLCDAVRQAHPAGMPLLVLTGFARGAWITSDNRPWMVRT